MQNDSLIDAQILVADSSVSDRDFLEGFFNDLKAKTFFAGNCNEVFQHLKNKKSEIDLILMDVVLPEIDGIETTKKIRDTKNYDAIPIILTTSKRNGTDALFQGLEVGANDYISKPYNPLDLVARCLSMLRQKKLKARNLELIHLLQLELVEHRIELEQTKDAALFGFAKLAETRDPDASSHLDVIREICMALAKKLQEYEPYRSQIDENFIRDIFKASPLHDIGKVAIPDAILLKPGKLKAEEFEIMKKHAEIGSKTLTEASNQLENGSFLFMANEIALCHHEKWDGSGYPKGLKGKEIPLSARIMAVADVFDALSSKRVYKEEMEAEEVFKCIKESAGSHFEPEIVDAFFEIKSTILDIKNRLKNKTC